MSEANQGLRDKVLQRYTLRYPAGPVDLSTERLLSIHLLQRKRGGKSEEEALRELAEECENWIKSEIETRRRYGIARFVVGRSDKGLEARALIFCMDRVLEIPLGHAGLLASMLLTGPLTFALARDAQQDIEKGRLQELDATNAEELAKRDGAESWSYEEIAQVKMRLTQIVLRTVNGREINYRYGTPVTERQFQESVAWLTSALGSRLLCDFSDEALKLGLVRKGWVPPDPSLSPLDKEIANALREELRHISSKIGTAPPLPSPEPTREEQRRN